MKKIWILSVRTSLPNPCYNADDLCTELFAFESFESAKNAFYDKYTELAYSSNEMFENGVLRALDYYIDDMLDDDIDDEFFLTKGLCNGILWGGRYTRTKYLHPETSRVTKDFLTSESMIDTLSWCNIRIAISKENERRWLSQFGQL